MDLFSIIERIKRLKSLGNDYQVAELLGFNRKAFSARKKSNSIPVDKLKVFCYQESIDLDWLLTGQGEPFPNTPLDSTNYSQANDLERIEFCYVVSGTKPGESPQFSPFSGNEQGYLFVQKNILLPHRGPFRTVKIEDSSIPPFLGRGDIVIVACGEKEIKKNHIYAVRTRESVSVAKLHKAETLLILDPITHEEPVITIDLTKSPDPLIGRVIGGLKSFGQM